jgi:hypothetical protein
MATSSMRVDKARSFPKVTPGSPCVIRARPPRKIRANTRFSALRYLWVRAREDQEAGDSQVDPSVVAGMAVAQHVRVAVGHLEVLRGALKAECLEATERDVDGDECAGGTEDCEDEAKGLRSGGRRRGAVRGGGH